MMLHRDRGPPGGRQNPDSAAGIRRLQAKTVENVQVKTRYNLRFPLPAAEVKKIEDGVPGKLRATVGLCPARHCVSPYLLGHQAGLRCRETQKSSPVRETGTPLIYNKIPLYIPDLETSQATLSYAFTSSHPPANPQTTLCRQKCDASHLDVEILQVQSQISLPTLNFII